MRGEIIHCINETEPLRGKPCDNLRSVYRFLSVGLLVGQQESGKGRVGGRMAFGDFVFVASIAILTLFLFFLQGGLDPRENQACGCERALRSTVHIQLHTCYGGRFHIVDRMPQCKVKGE